VSLEIEDVVDGAMGGDETLGLALRLETLHFALASTDREMGVLNPVVFAQSARLVTALALQHLIVSLTETGCGLPDSTLWAASVLG
jgi:hypothetical protein